MTAHADMVAAGERLLDLLTASEVAVRLRRSTGRGCSARKVGQLADADKLVRVRLGRLARYTPESVAAYEARHAGGASLWRAAGVRDLGADPCGRPPIGVS